ncbi:MAG: hypothetical protein JXQ73_28215 [Phycisphaerae bacterium]|nr:hypothetical protein [Phycisphaerae bacterium]
MGPIRTVVSAAVLATGATFIGCGSIPGLPSPEPNTIHVTATLEVTILQDHFLPKVPAVNEDVHLISFLEECTTSGGLLWKRIDSTYYQNTKKTGADGKVSFTVGYDITKEDRIVLYAEAGTQGDADFWDAGFTEIDWVEAYYTEPGVPLAGILTALTDTITLYPADAYGPYLLYRHDFSPPQASP